MPSAMRIHDRRAPHARSRALATIGMLACFVAACGGPAPSTAPSESAGPVSTPVPTPVALLVEPATADQVYRALVAAGLKLQANTAIGGPGQDPLKIIQASYAGWPLAIGQWSSSKALREAYYWKPGAKPGKGEPPFQFMGLNMLIQYGPIPTGLAKAPTDEEVVNAAKLRNALDALLAPLATRGISALPGAEPEATPTPAPTPAPKATKKPK